ncbi:MAG: histidine phosphatase family protein [Acidimicrobiales bacterium]
MTKASPRRSGPPIASPHSAKARSPPSTARRWNEARETAAPIGKATGQRVRVRKGLIEADFGDWTGKKLVDLNKLPEWNQVQRYPSGFRSPAVSRSPRCSNG